MNLVFAWSISIVVCLAGGFASLIASHSATLDRMAYSAPIAFMLTCASGAFCLGAISNKTNMVLLTALFGLPLLYFFPPSGYGSAVVGFIALTCVVSAGQSTDFKRGNTAFDIPWYHWLWLFPTTLFQTISIPLTLLFLFIQMDGVYVRLVLCILLPLCLLLICNAAKILARSSKLTMLEKTALVLSWLVLTIPEVYFIIFEMEKVGPDLR